MFRRIRRGLGSLFFVNRYIPLHIAVAAWFYWNLGLAGRVICRLMDRWLLIIFGIDLYSHSVDIRALSIAHPVGVLLGGNGIYSTGRVVIMAGVKFIGKNPHDPEFLRRHAERRTFVLGDNVVIGANTVVMGPLAICDNVIVGAMSLVNRSITEPGVYVGVPVRRVKSEVGDEWVVHLEAAK